MRKRDLYLDDYPHYYQSEGEIHGSTFIRTLRDEDLTQQGVLLYDELIDRLVEENINSIILVRDNGGTRRTRYTSTIEDWQEYGRDAGFNEGGLYTYATYLPFSYMQEG